MFQFGNYTAKPLVTSYYGNGSKQPAPWQNVGLGVQNLQYTPNSDTQPAQKPSIKANRGKLALAITAIAVLFGTLLYLNRGKFTPQGANRTPNQAPGNGFRIINRSQNDQRDGFRPITQERARAGQFNIRQNTAPEGFQAAAETGGNLDIILQNSGFSSTLDETRQLTRDFADENPEIAAQILIQWLHGEL